MLWNFFSFQSISTFIRSHSCGFKITIIPRFDVVKTDTCSLQVQYNSNCIRLLFYLLKTTDNCICRDLPTKSLCPLKWPMNFTAVRPRPSTSTNLTARIRLQCQHLAINKASEGYLSSDYRRRRCSKHKYFPCDRNMRWDSFFMNSITNATTITKVISKERHLVPLK